MRIGGRLGRLAGTLALLVVLVSTGAPHRALAQIHPEAQAAPAAAPAGQPAQVTSVALFPELSIASVQNALFPDSVPNDRQILLGGVGSDLWHSPDDPPNVLWMVTDRGPRGRDDDGKNKQAFAIPEYTPMLLQARLNGASVEVLQTIPIVGQSGAPVTGLPNIDGRDERPMDYHAKIKLPYNPSGLDPEGMVRTPNGDFWIADEYGPSLVHLDPNGVVLKRYVPVGIGAALAGADYPVMEALPAVFARRSDDGGFEGLTASPDGATLYLAMEGPLSNPNNDAADRSRNARILLFDVASEQVTTEYVYRFETVRQLDPSKKADPDDIKLSAIALCGDGQLLVLERTGNAARLYLAAPFEATNILNTIWDDVATKPSLEASSSLPAIGVRPLFKTPLLDLTNLPGVPNKLEGLAILDPSTIVVADDNDFDIGKFDKDGNNVGQGDRSQIVTIALPRPLP